MVSRAPGIGARFFREESDFTGMLLDGTFYELNVGAQRTDGTTYI